MKIAHQRALETLVIDAVTVQVVTALRERGVEPILLKGRSFATWLYADSEHRSYGDCDLLVAPDQRPVAEAVLATCDFEPMPVPPQPLHAQEWRRPSDGASLDLHSGIWGTVDDRLSWDELSRCTEPQPLGPIDVTVLNEAGRCVQVVLHWLHHGAAAPPRADLDRALAQVPDAAWVRAAELADRIGAGPEFLHGLISHPLGASLVVRLGLTPGSPPSRAHLLRVSRDTTGAAALDWIVGLPTWRARVNSVGRKLFPTSGYLRAANAQGRRWRLPTPLLYVRYWLRVLRKTPSSLRAWLSAWSVTRLRGTG